MERYRHGAGVVTYLARYLRGGPTQERPSGGVRRRLRHLHLSRAAGGGRRGARLSPTDDVARGGLSAAVAPPCPGASDAGRAVLWAVPSHATLRPWPSVVRSLANRRWRRQQRWTGKRCVRSVGRPILSGVPPVASGSCAPGVIPRGGAPPRLASRSARHEPASLGSPARGVVCLVAAGDGDNGLALLRGGRGATPAIAPSSVGLAGPVAGRITEGRPQWKLHSVRLPKPGQAASVRGQSNQVLSEVLRAGREVHRGALSPEHSR